MNIEQIIALLTAKFSGVRKDGLAHVARLLSLQATTEQDVQALIDKLDIDKVTEAITEYRRVVDKEVSEATKTHEANLRKKYQFKEEGNPNPVPPANPTPTTDDTPAWAKALIEANQKLSEEVSGIKSGKVAESRLQVLEGKLKDVPGSFKERIVKDFRRMNFESDEAFTEYLTETESDIQAFNQELADKGLSQQPRPIFGQQTKDGVSSAVQSYIDDKAKPGGDSLGGKEI